MVRMESGRGSAGSGSEPCWVWRTLIAVRLVGASGKDAQQWDEDGSTRRS